MSQNRRSFIKKAALAGAAAASATKAYAEKGALPFEIMRRAPRPSPKQTLHIALIGAGGMGTVDANTALEHEGVRITAVCDLYDGNLDAARERWGSHLFLTRKYEEVLSRTDVDVVIIGTPDHWHKDISIAALKAGKHVYCEKPMVHSISEGHELIKAWRDSGKIFMVGSQGLSSLGNEKARELLAAGVIGDINYAEGFWARHSPGGAWQYPIPSGANERTVDWARYVSNTTQRPYDPLRFFRWRNYRDYGTGMSGDLFVHLFSSLHFITNSLGPTKIAAMGGLRYWKDGREVPDVLLGMFDYPDSEAHPGFNLSLRCNFIDGTSGSTYLKINGSKGSLNVGWNDVTVERNKTTHQDDPFLEAKEKEMGSTYAGRKQMLPPQKMVYEVEKGYKGAHFDHFGNLFRAIREGGQVVEDPVFGFRACAPALLCNDSYFEDRYIQWDPVGMKVIG
ncbi:Gfo/Idh/MocA family protein [Phaeodactylibacter luteus]|uniref:Gfo/Idh/MocA family oxidoreductase n=1 Tax=Phaeodactylibacter luteus TaxID=1564516 RepID=A0A5C6S4Z0_9BACT|nr:Gfo/Idh/MocA family oxidoreductase [Phaeodactylibacter luteus]TXB69566.1 Gfo/Idh/MocA family oxidoreductase [Phaeodactylibacter luteus]